METVVENIEIKENEVIEEEPIRKMASVQKVLSLEPIKFFNKETGLEETAHSIELAKTLGWQMITKICNFKINDLAVFFEANSILPKTYWSEFLIEKNYPDRQIRIKSKRFKGVLSQGVLIPINQIKELDGTELIEGQDLTEILGVKKVEDVVDPGVRMVSKGQKPQFIARTDEISIQNDPSLINDFYDKLCFITQKVDGQSSSFAYRDNSFYVCSRNMNLKETEDSHFWKIAKEHDIENKLKDYYQKTGIEVVLQGEIASPSVQKNRLKVSKPTFFAFNVIAISGQRYYSFIEFVNFCKEYNIPTVPILKECVFKWKTVDELLEEAKGFYESSKFPQEGIVIKLKENDGKHASFKVINNVFRELTE